MTPQLGSPGMWPKKRKLTEFKQDQFTIYDFHRSQLPGVAEESALKPSSEEEQSLHVSESKAQKKLRLKKK